MFSDKPRRFWKAEAHAKPGLDRKERNVINLEAKAILEGKGFQMSYRFPFTAEGYKHAESKLKELRKALRGNFNNKHRNLRKPIETATL